MQAWTSFTEEATKNGGEIYYQLSDDGGASWKYWNGGVWTTSTLATDFNTSTDIHDNIGTFPTSSGQIVFRAFLESDGSQLVQLDTVRVSYGEESGGGGGGYQVAGSLVSSAFDLSDDSPVQSIRWGHTTPACGGCQIQFQVRTAPDSGGSPGVWSDWYGASGVGTYFTQATGGIIPLALNFHQWVQYRVFFAGDGTDTPILSEVHINYK